MEPSPYRPYQLVILLLVMTSLALAFTVDVRVTDTAGIKVMLPDQVGGWRGESIFYCLAPGCQTALRGAELPSGGVCPKCGGTLGAMSLIEKQLLPPDTALLKKRYRTEGGRQVYASVVLSGSERASIHRPEVCLVGQGSEIEGSHLQTVALAGRPPLRVKVLDMLYHQPGTYRSAGAYYAYWFVGHGRETPHHWQRMLWMATDRIFHNVSHRWAYIAVSGQRAPNSNAYQQEIQEFVSQLYPQMVLP